MRQVASLFLAMTLVVSSAQAQEPALNDQIRAAHAAGELDGLHGVIVTLGDNTLAEIFFPGDDENWGQPLGVREHGPDTLHDLRSVTKSVVGLLYGIALAEGRVPDVDVPLLDQFPDYADLAADPRRAAITVGDTLSMRMGTEWNEDLPYTDPQNSEIAMEQSDDRYRFALGRPMVAEPGSVFTYNGGAVALVAKLIADGTGMPIDEYAREKLFGPLGIDKFEWVKGSDGTPSAASGLRLTLPDLARIGRMIGDGGRANGQAVVPEGWLVRSFKPRSEIAGGTLRYGYLFWLSGWGDPPAWAAGFGNGGQRLTVQPEIDLTVAVFAGNYNQPDAWKLPVTLIEAFVAPAVRKRLRDE